MVASGFSISTSTPLCISSPGDCEMATVGTATDTASTPAAMQFVDGRETPACRIRRRSVLRARVVGIRHADKLDVLCRVGLQVAINAGVVASEGSGADNSYAQRAI